MFVDGCYWHGCSVHFAVPKRNSAWWAEKIADNRNRDAKRTAELRDRGWVVVRLWEHDLVGKTAKRRCSSHRTNSVASSTELARSSERVELDSC